MTEDDSSKTVNHSCTSLLFPLQANKRIDGLYVYLAPPSLQELEGRIRGRLKEAPTTITKRLEWAASEIVQVGGRQKNLPPY